MSNVIGFKSGTTNDDVVWADTQGSLSMSGAPHCVGCLPSNYGGDDE
jgi:hypothetical protein